MELLVALSEARAIVGSHFTGRAGVRWTDDLISLRESDLEQARRSFAAVPLRIYQNFPKP